MLGCLRFDAHANVRHAHCQPRILQHRPPIPAPLCLQRFRRLSEFDSESEDEAEEWGPGSDSEDEVGAALR